MPRIGRSILDRAKQIARRVPLVPALYGRLRRAIGLGPEAREPVEAIFAEKMRANAWRGKESVSGTGSDLGQTRAIAEQIPRLLRDLGAQSLLDIPCGDFHWMRTVDLKDIHYIGADIVPDLVKRNRRFASRDVEFRRLDLLRDPLPAVDVIFCRDCLVHLSFADVMRALQNICRSGSTHLLTTTFTDRVGNQDIPTGRWRVLNLARPPFNLPKPERLILEQCTEGQGKYADKALGLWAIETVRAAVEPYDTAARA